uniref:Variant surface glycoprotein 1473 n=1 Tax=Trypanosoma brucei TaxID=5691 RepID=M4T092_9TRYP|nr:variant surface glycoprotein 1473 [Trypanosoma brucei]
MSTFLAVLAVSAFLLRLCTDKGVATRTAEDAAIGADAWAKIVGVAADLRTSANVAALLNGKVTRLEQDGSQKHWKAEAFASTLSDVKLKERWHFLLLCLDGLIADNKRKHVLTTAALIEKTAQALHAAGHLGEFTKTVGRLLSGTNGCVCRTGAAGASCSAHYTAASPLPPVAPDKLGQVTEGLGNREHVTDKGFAKLGTSFGLNDNVQNNAGTGCKIFKRTDTEPNGAQGTAIDVPFAGGLLKRKGDDSEETLNLADLTTGPGANPTNLAKIPLMYEAWQALRDLTNAAQNAPEQTNLPTRADLAYNGKCQPHLMAAFKSEKKTDTDLTEQQYNDRIKQLFGGPSVDINEQFWKNLETATLNEQLLPRGSPKELKLIDDIATLMQASRAY